MEKLFPEDIKIDIFSRLPVESVLECRRVCKPWRTLLHHSNTSFAHLHLRRQLLQLGDDDDDDDLKYQDHSNAAAVAPSCKVGILFKIWLPFYEDSGDTIITDGQQSSKTVQRIGIDPEDKSIPNLLFYGDYDENDEHSYQTIKRIIHPECTYNFYIVNSCNGLLCLSHTDPDSSNYDPIYICNPITREYVNLPKFNTNSVNVKHNIGKMFAGFGCHPFTNVYKSVRIYYEFRGVGQSVGHVQVYTLGSGSGWRNIRELCYSLEPTYRRYMGVLVNGALHWVAEGFRILSFDLGEEEFSWIPSPPCFSDDWRSNSFLLQVLGHHLCVVHQKKGEFIDIWFAKKLKESNHQDHVEQQQHQSWSWSKEFRITCDGTVDTDYEPFFLTKSGKVLSWYGGKILTLYDPKTATLEKLVDHSKGLFQTTIHMNSFVSLTSLGEDAKTIGSVEGESESN